MSDIYAENHQRDPWPDPTEGMYDDPRAEAIWKVIKTWDIAVPGAYHGYCGASGNHVKAIMDAVTQADTDSKHGR